MLQKNNQLPRVITTLDVKKVILKVLFFGFLLLAAFKVGSKYTEEKQGKELDSLKTQLANANGDFYKSINVTVTSYQPTIEQCDSTPFVTASGHHITESSYYNTCAVSKDLYYSSLNFNDSIQLKVDGKIFNLLVTDIVAGSKHIDVLCPVNAKWKNMPQGKGVIKFKIK